MNEYMYMCVRYMGVGSNMQTGMYIQVYVQVRKEGFCICGDMTVWKGTYV